MLREKRDLTHEHDHQLNSVKANLQQRLTLFTLLKPLRWVHTFLLDLSPSAPCIIDLYTFVNSNGAF